MTERKFCWQTDYLAEPTPCFKKAGGTACETPGCTVSDRLTEIGGASDPQLIILMCHSRCRISSLSQDNGEYFERVFDKIS